MFTIQTGMELSTVQNIFHSTFPYLKLEFFRHRYQPKDANVKKDRLKSDAVVLNVTGDRRESNITITEEMSVTSLGQLFQDHFGLDVQVFRRSGTSWLETTVTDDWTLKKQNEQGRELSALGQR